MNAVALHEMAESFAAAFAAEVITVSKPERIIELADAQWVGLWEGMVLFRDPLTGSTCSLPEETLSVSGVMAKLVSKRAEFGVIS
jgi:hypothetical protein